MNADTTITINATPREIDALLALVQRAPMTKAETLFAEALFDRWYQTLTGGAQVEAPAPADPTPAAS